MVKISDKQRTAIENMENMIGVFNHREVFNTYDEVQEYFVTLQKEIKKKINFKKALISGKVDEWMKRKREKTIERLQDPEKLKEYAIFYYTKYFPSKEKLRRKLLEKNKNTEVINSILEKLSTLINDNWLLENKIINFISNWKNFQYIRNNLTTKWFNKDDIERILSLHTNEDESLLSHDKTRNKIIGLFRSWKSIQYIKQKFIENPNDEILVNEIIEELSNNEENDPEIIGIKKYLSEYQKKWFDKQKIIQKLMLKWFKYNKFKDLME